MYLPDFENDEAVEAARISYRPFAVASRFGYPRLKGCLGLGVLQA
jgi:hypothetical protein